MDFDDSGIESDPKVSSEKETLKQHNEPIISFSPERCRFDSAQSTSRKSSTSFPISVADLQLDEEPPLANHTGNLPNSGKPRNNGIPSKTTSFQRLNDHSINNQPLFHHNNSQQLKQAYPFLHNTQLSTSTSGPGGAPAAAAGGTLVISTHALSTTSSVSITSAKPTTPFLPTRSSVLDSSSISLMVNGAAVLSGNNNSSTTNSSTTPPTSSTTLDLQKRLEKRIAQASAIAAAQAATAASSSTISAATTTITTPSSTPFSSTVETKASDSILSEITGTANKSISTCSKDKHVPNVMPSSSPTSVWETDPSLDFWEKKVESEFKEDNFLHVSSDDGGGGDGGDSIIAHLDINCTSTATTSCTSGSSITTTTPSSVGVGDVSSNISSVDKPSSKNMKPKGNQSLRNNNMMTTSNVPGGGGGGGGGGGATSTSTPSAPPPILSSSSSSSSPSVITVVNASFDIRKVSALLPPQRLAIPSKSSNPQFQSSQNSKSSRNTSSSGSGSLSTPNNSSSPGTAVTFSAFSSANNPPPPPPASSTFSSANTTKTSSRLGSISETSCGGTIIQQPSGNGNIIKTGSSSSSKLSNDSEKKPLVQWDSDESEEELSFFPPAKRGVITDNLSIDNMSLSGEEEDLHLTPPRPLAKKCPCDPRSWMDRTDISASHHHHGDPTRVIPSKYSCVIS